MSFSVTYGWPYDGIILSSGQISKGKEGKRGDFFFLQFDK